MRCPNGHGPMELRRQTRTTTCRGVEISYEAESYVCPVCGLEAATVEQAARMQRAIADAYRRKVGLLTGEEIRRGRERHGWSQGEFARRAGVGIASIKRWEGGLIQSRAMDNLLRRTLEGNHSPTEAKYSGNRTFSVARVKLVLKTFERLLRRKLLRDRGLYAGKYLFYADMLAFRELGQSLTGASYARLPHGPQLNNYVELVQEIRRAEEAEAEPLSEEEVRIIQRVAMTFPTNRSIYQASHREPVVEQTPVGGIIPYTEARNLQEI